MKFVEARWLTLAGFALIATTTLLPTATVAQSPGELGAITEEIVDCGSIGDDGKRLACFDRSVEPLLGNDDEGTDDAARAFVGEGDWSSNIVTMDREWRISWESAAVQLTVEIRDADDYLVSLAATQFGEGSGTTSRFDPGEYRVNVRSVDGEWRVLLIEE